MDTEAPPSPPRRRTGLLLIAGAAVLGAAIAASGVVPVTLRMLAVPLRTPGWHVWFGTLNGVGLVTVAALPPAGLAAWALARRRRGSRGGALAWRRSLAEVGIVYGTVPLVWLTMQPGSGAGTVPARVSLVPLRDLFTMSAVQVVGNLLVFAALGALGPLRFAALASVPRILALVAGCSVAVEAAQYLLRLDRVSSVDDVLLNTAGAGLAALASRRWWATAPGTSPELPRPVPTGAA